MTAADALLAVVHRGLTVKLNQGGLGQPPTVTVMDEDTKTYSRVVVPPEAWQDGDLMATLVNRMADQVRPRLDPARLP